jgi:hypothetical protein
MEIVGYGGVGVNVGGVVIVTVDVGDELGEAVTPVVGMGVIVIGVDTEVF